MKNKIIILAASLFSISSFAFTSSKTIGMDGDSGPAVFEGGTSGSCTSVPSKVQSAFKEAQSFSRTCAAAKLSGGKKIVVNDYSSQGGETMYIFDLRGNCEMAMPISYGSGSGATKSRTSDSCSTPGSGKTPAGMHLTAHHDGATYNSSNSLKLAGLEGQNSGNPRQILIHASKWGLPAAVSQGCTGVPKDKLYTVMSKLGYGSLVYNYFGSGSGDEAKNCPSNAGQAPRKCQPESLAASTAKTYNGARSASSAERPVSNTERSGGGEGPSRGQGGTN